jgi:eukaryotic-like serine/threonine-protein kinase
VDPGQSATMMRVYEPGTTVAGKYRLLELLGEGGMGTVWRAHNETLDVDVAVKLLRRDDPENVEGPLAGDRLLQEARAAARLGHPAIARVFDFGVSDRGDAFIVMELLEGEDLAEALARRGRLSPTKAAATVLPIVHALAAAHAKGIVHRDIKPENIYLARGEDRRVQPKLVDFGIAKLDRAKNKRLTQTGTMLGSPLYMSPEQARGDDVDHLADVWALCVVLYEVVAGRTPFEGKNYNALLYSIIADAPVPLTELGFGDERFWQILARGLEKDPVLRWQSVRALGEELARWMIDQDQHEDITGASLSMQWLKRMRSSADLLASMVPPPMETLRPEADAEAGDRPSDLETTSEIEPRFPDVAPVPASVVARPSSLSRRTRRRRLVAIALVSAAFGAALAVTALIRGQETPKPQPTEVALNDLTAASVQPSTELPGQEPGDIGSRAALGAAALEPAAEPAASVSSGAQPETPSSEAEPGASVAKPATKARKRSRATKKSKLKNPFD